jgi:hypothetical protein
MRGLFRIALTAGAAALLVAAGGAASAAAGPVLSWAPTTSPGGYSYGQLTAGQTAKTTFTLTNSGGSASGALKITLTGSAAFAKTADTCTGTSLGPHKTCQVTVAYAPTTPGQADTGTLTATSPKPAATASLTLTGSAAKATPAITTSQQPATATVGGSVADQATVTGGSAPTGTVTFNLYGNLNCTGTPLFTDTEPLTGGGAISKGYTATATGTEYWTASYNGDGKNNPVTSGCADEPVIITPASPGITTSQQPANVTAGSSVADQATVTGGDNPTGTVTFSLYNNNSCTGSPLFTDTETLTSGSATSRAHTATAAGTDYWTASYNGDANNNPVTSACGEPVTITPASPALTTSSPGVPLGAAVTDRAALTGAANPTGTIGFKLYGPSSTADCTGTPAFTDSEPVSGTGTAISASFTPAQAGTYWWTVSYSGDANNNAAATNCGDESVTIGPHVYWTNFSEGTVRNANLDGTNPQILENGGVFQNFPGGIAVDSSHIYWVEGASTIKEANLDGTNPRIIVSGQDNAGGLAVDSSHIYWADGDVIKSANLDGTGVTTLVSGLNDTMWVAVDSSHIYWTDFDRTGGTIKSANLDGTGVTTLVTGLGFPLGIAVDSSHIYVVDGDVIKSANLDGSGLTTIVTGQNAPKGIAVDSSHIYWATFGDDTIMAANLDGTGVTTLVTGQTNAFGIAVFPR